MKKREGAEFDIHVYIKKKFEGKNRDQKKRTKKKGGGKKTHFMIY